MVITLLLAQSHDEHPHMPPMPPSPEEVEARRRRWDHSGEEKGDEGGTI